MSERDGYEPGVPCWVDHASDDPERAAGFYCELLGWEAEQMMPPDVPGSYFACTLRDRQVAACGSQPEAGVPARWSTYVAVHDADAAAQRARDAGGAALMEPFDVFDAGRMAVLQDPGGAIVMVWQAGRHRGAELVNEPGALAWNELTTRDVDGSLRFYGQLFGWRSLRLDAGPASYFTWHLAGAGAPDPRTPIGGLLPMEGDRWPAEMPAHWTVYFAVDDVEGCVARARALGGALAVEPFDTVAGRIALLADPLGAAFAVIRLAQRQG